ncbi:hypothetical protein CLFO_32620 [Clostridium formicaceticum]|uniref:Uncharacterized protein n=1 Tax=Clostridium formicaceticum TaxID=1497 RepID=A0AAC9RMN4_9CLOT|nr:hypothetical protein CLFO_32620 [Clostridium formicaceticum]
MLNFTIAKWLKMVYTLFNMILIINIILLGGSC